jgi:serine/threonine protein kinase
MAWRLLVIDGADEGRAYPLAVAGARTIGNSHNYADICLNDLYVGRIHCEVVVDGDRIEVAEQDNSRATFVNGQKIARQELHPGDVLRVGNSHLRLEEGEVEAEPDGDTGASRGNSSSAGPAKLPHLSPDRLNELSGHALGNYDLGRVLGRGYHGIVFQAVDRRDDQTVALKVLSPLFPHRDEEMQSFIQAMKIVLPVRHPHLIAVLGAGKTGPYCWIALEWIDGADLALAINPFGKRSWKRALRVAIHIGRALDLAGHLRICHGNITPRNILIRDSDKVGKLGDLVLMKALEGSQLQMTVLEDKLLAELPYLAPEQTPGEGTVDSCTDIHGLGAVVYALVTGRPPFEGKTPAESLDKIRGTMPVRPRELLEGVPPQLEAAIFKMLAKRPEDRFTTPAELLAELEPMAADLGVKV